MAVELFAEVAEAFGIEGEVDGESFVVLLAGGDEFGKIECAEETGTHAAGESLSDARQHGEAGP